MEKLDVRKLFVYFMCTVSLYLTSFIVKGLALRYITADMHNPFFELDYVTNTGGAFSVFRGGSFILAVVGLMIIFGIIFHICYNSHRLNYLKIIVLASFTAGIGANLFERFRYGFVTDYINLKFIHFPVFNFQDILIVTSAIILIILFVFNKNPKATESLGEHKTKK